MGHRKLVKAAKKLRPLDLPGKSPSGFVVINAVYFERLRKEIARSEDELRQAVHDPPANSRWRPTYANMRPTERLHRGVQDALKEYPKDLPRGFQYGSFLRDGPSSAREYEAVVLLTHSDAHVPVEITYQWDRVPPVDQVKDIILHILRGWDEQ